MIGGNFSVLSLVSNSNSPCSKSTFTNELNNIDNGTSAGGSREGSVESVLTPPDSVTGSKSPPKIGLRNSGSVTGEVFIECEVGSGRATECISTDRLFSSFRRVADDRKLQSDRTCQSLLQGGRTDQATPSHGLYQGMILYRKYSPVAILRSRDFPTLAVVRSSMSLHNIHVSTGKSPENKKN